MRRTWRNSPGLAAESYVLFLFSKSQAASAHLKPVFLRWARPAKVFAASGVVDVGENDQPEGGRFWRTETAERGRRNDQAMISGVI
jgi:hypothetical protein